MQSSSEGAQQKVDTDRDSSENLGRAWRCIDSPFGHCEVQTHCIVGRRLCCLCDTLKAGPPSAWQICSGGFWKLWRRETGGDGETNRQKEVCHSSPLSCQRREGRARANFYNRPTLCWATGWTPVKLRGQTVRSYTCPPAHRRRSITKKKKQSRWWCTLTACIGVNYGNGMQSSAWCHLTRQKHLNTPAIPLSGKQRGHLGWVGLWVFWQEQSRRYPVTLQRHPTVCSTQRQVDMPPQNLPGCRYVSPYIPHVWNSTA